MGLFDNVLPGGKMAKPLGIALLALLAYRATRGSGDAGAGRGGGLLEGLLGGSTEAGAPAGPQREQMQSAIPEALSSLVERFRQGGLGGIIDSWIGTGANQQIAPNQVNQALEPHEID